MAKKIVPARREVGESAVSDGNAALSDGNPAGDRVAWRKTTPK